MTTFLHNFERLGVTSDVTKGFSGISLGLLFCAIGFGQVSFEVASIKPVLNWPPPSGGAGERGSGAGGGCPTSIKVDPGRAEFRCASLPMLIGYAFRISPDRIQAPDWMKTVGSTRFNIQAEIPQRASKEQVPEMVRALLEERFHLVVHRGTTTETVLGLVVAKGGLKVKPAAGEKASDTDGETGPTLDGFYGATQSRTTGEGTTIISNPRMGEVRQTGDPYKVQRWEADNISFAGLADLLDNAAPVSLPVLDMTGVKGRYQLVLEVSLPRPTPGEPAAKDDRMATFEGTIIRAFNDGLKKLGLRLERRAGPVETIVVDHVEKTPTAN